MFRARFAAGEGNSRRLQVVGAYRQNFQASGKVCGNERSIGAVALWKYRRDIDRRILQLLQEDAGFCSGAGAETDQFNAAAELARDVRA